MLPNLKKWHRENRSALADLLFILAASAILYGAAIHFSFDDRLYELAQEYMRIGRLILLAVFLAFAFAVFSLRRWLDLRGRIWLANTDGLTGLNNQRRFLEILESEMARSKRHRRPLSLIMFDLDWFKNVNDEFGHSVGDEALKTVAEATRGALRELDYLARWGGDEFVVIATETDLEGAATLGERLRALIAQRAFRRNVALTASFGVTELQPGESQKALIQRVDQLLYRAKEAGRNAVCAGGPEENRGSFGRGNASLAAISDQLKT